MMTFFDRRPLLLALVASTALAQSIVPWSVETPPVATFTAGDMAIVVDQGPAPQQPTVILGADALTSGVSVYSLTGALVQVALPGATSGLDSRTNLALPGARTLAAVVSSTNATITPVHRVDAGIEPAFDLTDVISEGPLALTARADGGVEAWLGSRDLFARHFTFAQDGGLADGGFSGFVEADSVALPAAATALVVDDRTGVLYVAMPAVGVSTIGVGGAVTPLVTHNDFGSDVGGLTVYPIGDGGTLLLTSIPTANVITVHDVSIVGAPQLLGTFAVGPPDGGAQRVGASQALDVTPLALPGFPKGLLVVHDGLTANYKLVSLADLATSFVSSTGVPLPIAVPAVATPDGGTDAGSSTDGGSTTTHGGYGGIIGDPPSTCGCTEIEPVLPSLLLVLWVVVRRRHAS
jgi:3-phytase